MQTTSESRAGRATLLVGHVAGMIDLVALPLWVSGLTRDVHFSSFQAGLLLGLYVVGLLASNVVCGPRSARLDGRIVAGVGFGVAAISFVALTKVSGLPAFAALHLLAGVGAGAGLSCVHGAIGRSANPHRLFALVNVGVGVFAIGFYAYMRSHSVIALFLVVAALMAAAALVSLAAFPARRAMVASTPGLTPLSPASVRVLAFAAVVFLQAAEGAIYSFVFAAGLHHGFKTSTLGTMLFVSSVFHLLPPIAAGLLQRRLSPTRVAVGGMFLHGCASLIICNAGVFWVFAIAAAAPVTLIIFSHIFIFGFLAKLDRGGRMAALTPSMIMIGTAAGPVIGGAVLQGAGFGTLGIVAAALAWAGSLCFVAIRRIEARDPGAMATALALEPHSA